MNLESQRPIRVLMAKTSLDGHIRGVIVVSKALRDAGMEVIYGGMLRPGAIVATALEEDVDVIGLNIGGRYGTVRRVLDLLREKKMENVLIIAGGPIPPEDIPLLKEWGIKEVFPPGSSLASIVECIRSRVKKN